MQIVSKQQSNKPANKVEALSVLPVFFSLVGKCVIVAGGTEAAAWKAELLAASGALVDVCAVESDLSEEMRTLISNGAAAGKLRHLNLDWIEVDFHGAALAVGDIHEEDAPAFVFKARQAGMPVNVIDKPKFCDFQFGSIVNRSPIVIGISTDGAAPILGQAVRRKIEVLLPASLSDWGSLARDIRSKVMSALDAGMPRRLFWERFVDQAFSGKSTPDRKSAMDIAGAGIDKAGRVTLVGAGPGDAELLTIKAVRALQSADVVLFDDLVSAEVLELARREAKRILVGKRGYRESCKQDDINAMMLNLAKQGKHVVRLKSGDPMSLGYAGEEIIVLESNGISISVVPGINAGTARSTRLGASTAYRDPTTALGFTAGYSKSGGDIVEELEDCS